MEGLFDKIKDFYLRLEDRYYAALDKVDAKVPIYGVIDRVDRVVPSFLILIAVAVLVVAWAALMLAGGIAAPATLAVTVLDEQDSPIEGALVSATFFGGSSQAATDANGEARLRVPLGAVVELLITKDDFEDKAASITVSKAEQPELFTLRSLAPLPTEKTIQFVDAAGRRLAGTSVSVSFSCSNAGIAAPAPVVVSTAELKITPPKGCGIFTVTATAPNYRSASYAVEQSMQIMLDALASGQGSLKITVSDADTGAAVNGIKVVLQNSLGIVDTRYTDFGEVLFSGIVPAEYYATVEDEAGDYGSETITAIAVAQGTITRREAQISKSVKANLSVTAKDKASGAGIADVDITLYTTDGLAVSAMKTGGTGVANFAVRDAAQYYVRGFNEAYLVSELIAVDLSTATGGVQKSITVEMEKLTADNSGRVEVKVLDEDSLPVENATVSLFDAQTEFLAGYPPQATDANGIARFRGVKAGTYYALAQKYPASGKSGSGTVDVRTLNEFAVNIVIGNATVEISAVDLDGEPVPFAVAELRAENRDVLGSISLDEQGLGSKEVKADKRVFVTVSKAGYARYTSAAVQLFKDQPTMITAILEEEILGNKPAVLFKGLYRDGSEAQKLEAGGTYTAKLQLRIPTAASYTQAGVHFRTGTAELVDNDKIFINAVNAPNASYLLGETYSPPSGKATDSANLTNADAKWANVWWDSNIAPGVYNIEFELKVRAETVQGTALPVNYRAWAVGAAGAYLRDPEDAELGTAEDGAGKQALYAQVYTRNYFEGADEQCDAQFCFAERLFNPAEGLYESGPPYTVKIFQDYNFTFSITNNSPTVHDNANLRVRNTKTGATTDSTVRIRSYKITNADAQSFTRTTETFYTEAIAAGDFRQNKTISGDMILQAAKIQNSDLELKIISEGSAVFNQAVAFKPVHEEDLVPVISPEVLAAYTNIDLNVHVTYNGGNLAGLDVVDALVRVTRISPDHSETIQTAKTSISGVAEFVVPPSSPNTKIRVQVEKAGYASSEVEKIVTCGVIEFTTEDGAVIDADNPISSALNIANLIEQEIPLKARSLVPQRVEITSMSVVDAEPGGVFYGLLDIGSMNNWLAAYEGLEFTAIGHERDVAVRAKLSAYARSELTEKETLGGFVKGALGGPAFTQTCEFSLPIDIDVSLVPTPEEEDCLDIDNWEWKEPITGSTAQWQFTITNNCMAEGSDEPNIDVEKLKATLDWESNEYGDVTLTIIGTGGGSSTVMLEEYGQTAYPDILEAGEEYTGLLSFNPYAPVLAEKPTEPAKFKISFEADVWRSEGGDVVKTNKDIEAELTFVDAGLCVRVITPGSGSNGDSGDSDVSDGDSGDSSGDDTEEAYVEPVSQLVLEPDEDEATFQIDTSLCGVKMDITLCAYDNGKCKGGAPEGEIGIDQWALNDVLPNRPQTVTVRRKDIPGYYDIEIKVKPEGSASYQKVMLLPVIIKPDGKRHLASVNYFSMTEGYKIMLLGDGATELTSLKNNYATEFVRVHADNCAWGESSDNYDYANAMATIGVVGGVGTALGAAGVGIAWGVGIGVLGSSNIVAWMSVGLAAIPVVGWVIIAVVVIDSIITLLCDSCDWTITNTLVDMFTNLFGGGDDCSDSDQTNSVPDTIISLKNDYVDSKLEFGDPQIADGITKGINTDEPVYITRDDDMPYNTDNKGVYLMGEEVGLSFTNNNYENPEPVYGVFSITTYENVHGDTLHLDPRMECYDGEGSIFGPGSIYCRNCEQIINGELQENCNNKAGCVVRDYGGCGTPGTQFIATTKSGASNGIMPPSQITAKFHMRFDTQPFETGIPDVEFDTADCTRGTMVGAIGESAPLPRVQYNWDWSSIPLDYCDAGSPDPMYCDATQFTIMLNKRMYALYEFLAAQPVPFELPCPPRIAEAAVDTFNSENSTHTVPYGQIGMNNITVTVDNTTKTATISATVENNTDKNQSGSVHIVTAASDGSGVSGGDCTMSFDLNNSSYSHTNIYYPRSAQTVYCTATGLLEDTSDTSGTGMGAGGGGAGGGAAAAIPRQIIYESGAVVMAAQTEPGHASSTSSIDGTAAKAMFFVEGGDCWLELRTTDAEVGGSMILPWVQHGGVNWTTAVPDAEALDRLVNFEAYLMRDGFSDDFMADFVHYYTLVNSFDTPTYFNGLGYGSSLSPYGFATLFENSLVKIGNKWDITQNELSSPGLYAVNVAAVFGDGDQNDWSFFETDGTPHVAVPVMLQKLSDPGIPSPFYWLPMDGFVGVGPDYTMDRQGYGTSFENDDTTKLVQLDNSATPFKTYPDAGSNAIVDVSSKVEDGFNAINSDSDTYGTLLDVSYNPDGTANITIAPQYATPVMMKVSRAEPSSEKFGAFYSGMQSGTTVDSGDSLARWEGAGNCLDFSGMAVWEKFNSTYDRRATQQDLINWMKTYGVDWDSIVEPGNVYLRTIFYTPATTSNMLKAMQPLDSIQLITPDGSAGTTVSLNGITGMPFNSPGSVIDSIEDVFQLVRSGAVCVTPTSTTMKFWWSPRAIYDAQGSGSPLNSYSGDCAGQLRSIHCETVSLTTPLPEGSGCISGDELTNSDATPGDNLEQMTTP